MKGYGERLMCDDNDIKIAGNRPSDDIKKNTIMQEATPDSGSVVRGKRLGTAVANEYVKALNGKGPGGDESDAEMLLQRQILLSFSAQSGFEQFCSNGECVSAAKRAFFETLKTDYPELYRGATDNGALSFYYLAFRRQSEVERRVGQTFAMLCAHDGDPVYQELGEALYCWFTSVVKKLQIKTVEEN